MTKTFAVSIAGVALVLGLASGALAQDTKPTLTIKDFDRPGRELPEVTPGPGWKTCPRCQNPDQEAAAREKVGANQPFNPRDLSGVWGNDGIPLTASALPPMTPYGRQLWEATQALANPREPTGAKNGGPGSKDPMMLCDPLGYPRLFTYNYGMEFVQMPNRVMQFFEWGHTWRTIWTDGRPLPTDPPEARFLGYSIGRWEGDTFVIESNGFEPSTWIDQDRRSMARGLPHSEEMRVVERWTRTSLTTMNVELTIIDPKVYTAAWTTKGTEKLHPNVELGEYFCVPSFSDFYNTRVVGLERK
jgi:hypothetical protein